MKNKKIIKILLINSYMFLALILSIFVYKTGFNQELSDYVFILAIVTIIQLILNLISLRITKIGIFSPIGIFVFFLYIFNFGQVFLKGFILKYTFSIFDVSMYVGDNLFIKSCNFCLVIIFLFMIGVLISSINVSGKNIKDYHEQYFMYCKPIGYIFLMISLPFMLYIDINKIIVSISYGYHALSIIHNPGYFGFLSNMFLPAVVLLLFAYKENKFVTKLIFFTTIAYKTFAMLGGQRGYSMIFIIVLIYFYTKSIQRMSLKSMVLFAGIVFFLLTTLNVLKSIRGVSGKSLELIYSNYALAIQNNIIYKNLEEFGGTLFTTSLSLKHFPDTFKYLYGSGYYLSLLTVFPNIGGLLNSIVDKNWAIRLSSVTPGIGGSFIAELYANFGILSYIFAIIFGFLIGKFSNAYEQRIKNHDYLFVAAYSLAFSSCLWWVRGTFEMFIRNTLWTVGIIYILYIFLKQFSKGHVTSKN